MESQRRNEKAELSFPQSGIQVCVPPNLLKIRMNQLKTLSGALSIQGMISATICLRIGPTSSIFKWVTNVNHTSHAST